MFPESPGSNPYSNACFLLYSSENPRFVESLKELESSPVCQSLKMQSFLMLPMQRITRLPLLIDAIFSRLDSNSSEFEVCREALEIINKVNYTRKSFFSCLIFYFVDIGVTLQK